MIRIYPANLVEVNLPFFTFFLLRVLARQFQDVLREQNSVDSLELVPLISVDHP